MAARTVLCATRSFEDCCPTAPRLLSRRERRQLAVVAQAGDVSVPPGALDAAEQPASELWYGPAAALGQRLAEARRCHCRQSGRRGRRHHELFGRGRQDLTEYVGELRHPVDDLTAVPRQARAVAAEKRG